jgi:hypothetical protein
MLQRRSVPYTAEHASRDRGSTCRVLHNAYHVFYASV